MDHQKQDFNISKYLFVNRTFSGRNHYRVSGVVREDPGSLEFCGHTRGDLAQQWGRHKNVLLFLKTGDTVNCWNKSFRWMLSHGLPLTCWNRCEIWQMTNLVCLEVESSFFSCCLPPHLNEIVVFDMDVSIWVLVCWMLVVVGDSRLFLLWIFVFVFQVWIRNGYFASKIVQFVEDIEYFGRFVLCLFYIKL